MTVQKTLKLTALSLGIASIALTGCKGKDGDKGVDGKSKIVNGAGEIAKDPITGEPIKGPKPLEDGTETTVSHKYKNENGEDVIVKKTYNKTKHKIKIVTSDKIPSNGCVNFTVQLLSATNDKVLEDITALFTGVGTDSNLNSGVVQVTLNSASERDFVIEDGQICSKSFLSNKTENKFVRDQKKRVSQGHGTNGSHENILEDIILTARMGDLEPAQHIIKVVDAQVNVIGLSKADKTVVIPHGAVSFPIPINAELVERKSSALDSRAKQNKFRLYERIAEVTLKDKFDKPVKITYNKEKHGWEVHSKDLAISSEAKAYKLSVRIIPNLAANETEMPIHSEEIYIKVVPAIPVSYKLHKLHTNVHARQSFDIKAKYTDGTERSIYSAQDTKNKGFNDTFKVSYKFENVESENEATAFSIKRENSTGFYDLNKNVVNGINIYSEELTYSNLLKNKKDYEHLPLIEINGTKEFSSIHNNFYKLTVTIDHTRDYLTRQNKVMKDTDGADILIDEDLINSDLSANQLARTIDHDTESNWKKAAEKWDEKHKLEDKHFFVVSNQKTELKQQFYGIEGGNNYDKLVTTTASSGQVAATSVELPQGGKAYDTIKKNLCVKALPRLFVGNVEVNGFQKIAKLEQLVTDNKNFDLYFDNVDKAAVSANYANSNIICASNKADLKTISFNAAFQDRKSNNLNVTVVKAVETPRVVLAFDDKLKRATLSASNKEKGVSLFYLMSNEEIGSLIPKTSNLYNELVVYGENQSSSNYNISPMSLSIDTAHSIPFAKLLVSNTNFDSSSFQYQEVKFKATPSSFTRPATVMDKYFSHVNNLELDKGSIRAVYTLTEQDDQFFNYNNINTDGDIDWNLYNFDSKALDENIATKKVEINTLDGNITSNNDAINTKNTAINTLKQDLDTKKTRKAALEANSSRTSDENKELAEIDIPKLENDLQALKTQLTALENTKTDLAAKKETLENELKALQADKAKLLVLSTNNG